MASLACSWNSKYLSSVREDNQLTGTKANSDSIGDVGFIFFFSDPYQFVCEEGLICKDLTWDIT